MFHIINGSNSINNTSPYNQQSALLLDAGDHLLVQYDGSILATGTSSTAVYLDGYGTGDTVTVNGLVMGTEFGIYSLGQYASISVSGQVFGQEAGVSIASGGRLFVSASGLVSGDEGVSMQDNSTLINNGTINGNENDAIQLSSGTINNNGLISSSFESIFYGGDAAGKIVNTGTIQGSLYTFDQASAATAKLIINNSGTWNGDLILTPGDDAITNSGHITGLVSLGDGNNTFDSRHGQIDDLILGGKGVDTIMAGKDGETMFGGAGHDNLFGGSGADMFGFTSFLPADTDRIHGFNVTNDGIMLSHAAFTTLAVDKAPVFAIGSAATSTSDHLFYNAATGVLSYDTDGSGTAAVAHPIATLDTGLALTAQNFTVV